MYLNKPKIKFVILCFLISVLACKETPQYPEFETWVPYDETALIDSSQNSENPRLRYNRLQSKVLDKNELLKTIRVQLDGFNQAKYIDLSPFIFEKSITDIQSYIDSDKLTYKDLTQWYLYRIAITETDSILGLNSVISINPSAVEDAERLDNLKSRTKHPIFGMPILLKDNINTKGMPTTAGAMALQKNIVSKDAEIVSNLKANKAIILGKVNLSEWANFLCAGCPNGYSATGGQTFNPYGPKEFDTGGSSSGSAVSVAANYAVAAVGTETSGSILSPASQQSLVGLKPTVKTLSQEGIVPISSTLDTPGPITKTVNDNYILYSAMLNANKGFKPLGEIKSAKTYRLGAIKGFMQDSLYKRSVEALRSNGAQIEILESPEMDFSGFLALLNGDMKRDLKTYLKKYASDSVSIKSIQDLIKFNSKDSLLNIPYAQARLDGIVNQDLSNAELDSIRQKLIASGKSFFNQMIDKNNLDAIVSINNYNAGQAAVAMYPAITVPMGYKETGEPVGFTFIAKSSQENLLYDLALYFESLAPYRKTPESYKVE